MTNILKYCKMNWKPWFSFQKIWSKSLSLNVMKDKNFIPDIDNNKARKKLIGKLSKKEKEHFNDSFYHEQLSRLKFIHEGDNVFDSYLSEPIQDDKSDILNNISIDKEELNILSDFIYIDDNGKIRIDKEKLELSQENSNIDIILKFMCIYLSNFVPDKNDYERSLMNLVLSSDYVKQIERNLKDNINWKKASELLNENNNQTDDTQCNIVSSIEDDIKLNLPNESSKLFEDFKNKSRFPIVYANGISNQNHICIGLLYPEMSERDEYFHVYYPYSDTTQCLLFSFNEAIKRAIIDSWLSLQVCCNSTSALKIVYDLVTLDRSSFIKVYPDFSKKFQLLLDELKENSLKLNINWAIYNNSCPHAQKLHSKLSELRSKIAM